jgi:hypothetical protein
MVDMPLPDLQAKGRWYPPVTAFALKHARWLLTLLLVSSACSIAVNEMSEKDKCQTTFGRLAVKLKLDSYYSGCECMKLTADLTDVCNLVLVPAAL